MMDDDEERETVNARKRVIFSRDRFYFVARWWKRNVRLSPMNGGLLASVHGGGQFRLNASTDKMYIRRNLSGLIFLLSFYN